VQSQRRGQPNDLAASVSSEIEEIWYLDDGSIGGELRDLLHDLDTVRRVGATLGQLLNENKYEIVTNDDVSEHSAHPVQ
jgi:hypothetical protein